MSKGVPTNVELCLTRIDRLFSSGNTGLAVTIRLNLAAAGKSPGPPNWCARIDHDRASVHGYLAHQKQCPPQDPAVGLCLGTYGGPGGVVVAYEQGSPVAW